MHHVVRAGTLLVLHSAETPEACRAWLAADSKRVGLVMDEEGLRAVELRQDARREIVSEPEADVQATGREQLCTVRVRMTQAEADAIDRRRGQGESRADYLRRLAREDASDPE